jgi:cytochrome P450
VSDWDPADPAVQADPFPTHARLRATCPVAHADRWGGFWTVTTYEDVRRIGADRENFTATVRTIVPSSPRQGLPRYPLQADPPRHTVYRRALAPWFADPAVARLEPAVRAMAAELLAPLITGEPADVVGGFTEEMAVRSLCLFVGLDAAEATRLKTLSLAYVEAVLAQDLTTAGGLSREIDGFAIGLVADRRRAPLDPATDLTTGLLMAQIDGERFTDEEVAGMIRTLLIGGHTVQKNFVGSALRHLGEDAELQSLLRADPSRIPAAMEEMLRLHSPNQALARTTTRVVCIRDRTIPAGAPVALLYLSANRDESVFPDPDRFDMDREGAKHLAFGYGIHACIGQPFARLQARVALEEALARTSRFAVEGQTRNAVWPEYGVAAMAMRLFPA